jgi:aminopeptidase N
LRFDLGEHQLFGQVTHSLSVLRDAITTLAFDSVGLTIKSVAVNGKAAKFETTSDQLRVDLDHPARTGERLEVSIQYSGKPKRGLYFILPDKDYPSLPKQIWTQGESEDTRYYIPIYDYPNDRLTTEMLVTVPRDWLTVSNGRLLSVADAPNGQKTWHWNESLPSSSYLISLVAGEFDEARDAWRDIPVTYYAPRGRGDRLRSNYGRTPQMLDYFSKILGVSYPWEKYAQSMVDDFVEEGMENTSATTNSSNSLVSPRLISEFPTDQDSLISHELAHQWFGDLVTCKDWGNAWLNEGFATFLENVWMEHQYGEDEADYRRWQEARGWFAQLHLFGLPLVRYDFSESEEFDDNVYSKGDWVLFMLRQELGRENFYAALKHYLEKNRGQNVVTADLAKAVEEATATNIDAFLDQWVYGAGAPKFDVQYVYDGVAHAVKLLVKQTQKVEGRVGLFTVPVDVEISTAAGSKTFRIVVSRQEETFTFPADSEPYLVLFDRGDRVFKALEFHKDKQEWLYQLKNAASVLDRADATLALAKFGNDDAVVVALGEAACSDPFWGVRAEAARALGSLRSPAAAKQLLAALANEQPWLRAVIVSQLGYFKDDPAVAERVTSIARNDASYRSRAAALQALGRLGTSNALSVLHSAASKDSPDHILEHAALLALGSLGDDRAAPLLLAACAPGKPIQIRRAAISSLGRLDRSNKDVTRRLIEYLNEARFEIRLSAVTALGERGDKDALPALEALLHSGELSLEFAPMIESQIKRLEEPAAEKPKVTAPEKEKPTGNLDPAPLTQHPSAVEKEPPEVNERLKEIENRSLLAGK